MIVAAPEGAYWCVVATSINAVIVLSSGLSRDDADKIASDINKILSNVRPIRPMEICVRPFQEEANA